MNPYLENLCISILTGIISVTGMITASGSEPRDWAVIAAAGIGAFASTFINGMRQLNKPVPTTKQ